MVEETGNACIALMNTLSVECIFSNTKRCIQLIEPAIIDLLYLVKIQIAQYSDPHLAFLPVHPRPVLPMLFRYHRIKIKRRPQCSIAAAKMRTGWADAAA